MVPMIRSLQQYSATHVVADRISGYLGEVGGHTGELKEHPGSKVRICHGRCGYPLRIRGLNLPQIGREARPAAREKLNPAEFLFGALCTCTLE